MFVQCSSWVFFLASFSCLVASVLVLCSGSCVFVLGWTKGVSACPVSSARPAVAARPAAHSFASLPYLALLAFLGGLFDV